MDEKYSLVIPVYNEEKVLELCYKEIKKLCLSLDGPYEIIFVNDGSKDRSMEILSGFAQSDQTVKVISFSRNFGHQAAVSAGMKEASGEAVIIMDADLQDPPEAVKEMIKKWQQGYEIVYGKRIKRKGETLFKKITAFFYYRFLARITELPIPRDTGDFRLISKKAAEAISALPEKNKYLRGLNSWVGFKQAEVLYERNPRAAGETKYTMKKMVKLAEDGIISNTSYPLKAILKTGIFSLIASVLGFVAVLTLVILGIISDPVFWLMPLAVFCMSVLEISLGIAGIYLGRVYDEVKDRPSYIISEKINF